MVLSLRQQRKPILLTWAFLQVFFMQTLFSQAKADSFYPTYNASNVVETPTKITCDLTISDRGTETMGANIDTLSFEAYFNDDNTLRVLIRDKNNQRFEPDTYPNAEAATANKNFKFTLTQSPFSFQVLRTDDNAMIFDTALTNDTGPLYYSDKYIEISSQLAENPNIYGLGERVSTFKLATDNTRYTIWTLAQDCPFDDGHGSRGLNMYGHHPVYLQMQDGEVHGIFFHNFNAQDVKFENGRVKFITIGGIVDLYVFLGPGGEDVLKQYHSVIGYPQLPPYWAMGFHQCRWGYKNLAQLKNVISGYEDNMIPFDVLWSDIDYMNIFENYTLDTTRYSQAGMQELIQGLKDKNRYYVPIIDAGVKYLKGYKGYELGNQMGVYIKRNAQDDQWFIGQVWPGQSVFIDFLNPQADTYWHQMLDEFHNILPFDGIWLDMNEASSFCDGECPGTYDNPETKLTLPYTPGDHSLEDQLLPLLAKHYGGDEAIEFNYHSLYSYFQTKSTNAYLAQKTSQRPFILSRSSRAGQGVYSNHWLGDNYSTWSQLRYTIPGILNFQIYGIPLTGADVCGFHNNTTVELCSRWIELGSLYPFFRNHNDIGTQPQEFYTLGDEVQYVAQKFIGLRYSLHQYMYSLIFETSLTGGSVWRPMFFEFPSISELYGNEEQFMIGDALLSIPVLEKGAISVTGYIPDTELWYDYFTGNEQTEKGPNVVLSTPIDQTNLLLRGGKAIPYYLTQGKMTLAEVRQGSVNVLVGLNSQKKATGSYYMDDGLSLDTISGKKYSKYNINVQPDSAGKLKVTIEAVFKNYQGHKLGEIMIYGMKKNIGTAKLGPNNLMYSQEDDVVIVKVDQEIKERIEVELH